MAKFGWAYVDCAGAADGAAFGPTGSVQFLTGSGDTSGSLNFMYYTASAGALAASTLVLTGTLVVTGTISASHYHLENVAVIDGTGSTYFGNSNDDKHIRTGSMYVGRANGGPLKEPLFEVDAVAQQIIFSGSGHRESYNKIAATPYTTAATSHILGVTKTGNVEIRLHSGSAGGVGQVLVIKDEVPLRVGIITISASIPAGNFNIESNGFYELSGTMPAINLYTDGTNWFVY
jgi:hypothetical protein